MAIEFSDRKMQCCTYSYPERTAVLEQQASSFSDISFSRISSLPSTPERRSRRPGRQRADKFKTWDTAFDDIPAPQTSCISAPVQNSESEEPDKMAMSLVQTQNVNPIVNTPSRYMGLAMVNNSYHQNTSIGYQTSTSQSQTSNNSQTAAILQHIPSNRFQTSPNHHQASQLHHQTSPHQQTATSSQHQTTSHHLLKAPYSHKVSEEGLPTPPHHLLTSPHQLSSSNLQQLSPRHHKLSSSNLQQSSPRQHHLSSPHQQQPSPSLHQQAFPTNGKRKAECLDAINTASATEIIANEGIDFDEISRLATNIIESGLDIEGRSRVVTDVANNVTNMDVVTMSPASVMSSASIMSPASVMSPYRDLEDSDSVLARPIPKSKRTKVYINVDDFNLDYLPEKESRESEAQCTQYKRLVTEGPEGQSLTKGDDSFECQFKKFLGQDSVGDKTNKTTDDGEKDNKTGEDMETADKHVSFEEIKARRAARKSEVLGHLVRAPNLSNINEVSENPSGRISTETNCRLSSETSGGLSASGRLSTDPSKSRKITLSPTKEVDEVVINSVEEAKAIGEIVSNAINEKENNEGLAMKNKSTVNIEKARENSTDNVQTENTEEVLEERNAEQESNKIRGGYLEVIATPNSISIIGAVNKTTEESIQKAKPQEKIKEVIAQKSIHEPRPQGSIQEDLGQKGIQETNESINRRKSVYQSGLPESQQDVCEDTVVYERGVFVPGLESTRLGNMTGLVDASPISTPSALTPQRPVVTNRVEEAVDEADGASTVTPDVTKSRQRISMSEKVSTSNSTSEKVVSSNNTSGKVASSTVASEKCVISNIMSEKEESTRNVTSEKPALSITSGKIILVSTNETDEGASNNATLEKVAPNNATLEKAAQSNATLEKAAPSNATPKKAMQSNATLEKAAQSNATFEKGSSGNASTFVPIVNAPSPKSRNKYEPLVASPLVKSSRLTPVFITESAENSTNELQNKSTSQSADRSTIRLTEKSSNQPMDKSNNQPTEQFINQSVDKSTNHHTDNFINSSKNESANELAEKSVNTSVETPSNRSARKFLEGATNEISEKSTSNLENSVNPFPEKRLSVATQDYQDISVQCYETPEYLREARRSIKNNSIKHSLYISRVAADDIAEDGTQTTPSVTLERLSLDKIDRLRRSLMSETASQVTPSLSANPGLSKTLGLLSKASGVVDNRERILSNSIAVCVRNGDTSDDKSEGSEPIELQPKLSASFSDTATVRSDVSETEQEIGENVIQMEPTVEEMLPEKRVNARKDKIAVSMSNFDGNTFCDEIIDSGNMNDENLRTNNSSDKKLGVRSKSDVDEENSVEESSVDSEITLGNSAGQHSHVSLDTTEEEQISKNLMKSSNGIANMRTDGTAGEIENGENKRDSEVESVIADSVADHSEDEKEITLGKCHVQSQESIDTTEEEISDNVEENNWAFPPIENEERETEGDNFSDYSGEKGNDNWKAKLGHSEKDKLQDRGATKELSDQDMEEETSNNKMNDRDHETIEKEFEVEIEGQDEVEDTDEVEIDTNNGIMDNNEYVGRLSLVEIEEHDKIDHGEENVVKEIAASVSGMSDNSFEEIDCSDDITKETEDQGDENLYEDHDLDNEEIGLAERKRKTNIRKEKEARQATLDRYLGVQDNTADVGISQFITPEVSTAKTKPKKAPRKKPTPAPKTIFPAKNIKFEFQKFSRYKLKKDAEETLCNASQDFMDVVMARLQAIVAKRGASKIHLCDVKQVMVEAQFIPKVDPRNLHLYDTLMKSVRQDVWMELIPRAVGNGTVYPPEGCWEDTGLEKKGRKRSSEEENGSSSKKKKTSASKVKRFKVPVAPERATTSKKKTLSGTRTSSQSKKLTEDEEKRYPKNGGKGRKNTGTRTSSQSKKTD